MLKGFRATLDKPRKVYIKFSFDGSFKRDRTRGNQRAAEPVSVLYNAVVTSCLHYVRFVVDLA